MIKDMMSASWQGLPKNPGLTYESNIAKELNDAC